jgi:hypothetical protein
MQMAAFAKTGLAVLVGVAIGAVSMQVLRAQSKPPAYVISEINVRDQDPYTRESGFRTSQAIGEKYADFRIEGLAK